MSVRNVRLSSCALQLLAILMLALVPATAFAQSIIYPPSEIGATMVGSGNYGVGTVGPSKFSVAGDIEIADGSTSQEYVQNGVDWTSSDGHIANGWSANSIGNPPIYPSIVTGNGFSGNAQRVQYGQGTDVIPSGAFTGPLQVSTPMLYPGTTYLLSFKYRSNRTIEVCFNSSDIPVWVGPNTAAAQKITVLASPSVQRNALQFYMPGGGVNANVGDWLEVDDVSIRIASGGALRAHGNGIFDGNVGIGTTTPASKLSVVGDINATGVISGGNVQANYQDLAEWVPADAAIPAGTVVVLDPKKTNHVIPSSSPYDATVAGVISAQPGIILGKASSDRVKVATTGRVKVHVDANAGAIHIGDLLVTSDRPGTAMRSQPVLVGGIAIHRPGTVIGKALEPLSTGKGDVLVLLSLQ
jgi:hypothetical protein